MLRVELVGGGAKEEEKLALNSGDSRSPGESRWPTILHTIVQRMKPKDTLLNY